MDDLFCVALPCPFCGEDPSCYIKYDDNGSNFEFAVCACENLKCHIRPKVGSTDAAGKAKDSAIRRWNIRK